MIGPAALAVLLDATAGASLAVASAVEWPRRTPSQLALAAASVAWFVGSIAPALALVHRGPLVHALLLDRRGRLSRPAVGVVVLAYGLCVASLVTGTRIAWSATGAVLGLLLAVRAARTPGGLRAAELPILLAGAGYGAVLVGAAALGRLAGPLYAGSVIAVAAASVWRVRAESRRDARAGVVLELGRPLDGTALRRGLAHAVGDPTLMIGYEVDGELGDEDGRRVTLVEDGSRSVTRVVDGDDVLAVLVHDAATLSDPEVLHAVTGALRVALENARLRTLERAELDELVASRRRLLVAADQERARLHSLLEAGPMTGLGRVAGLVVGDPVLTARVADSQSRLRDFGAGLAPDGLDRDGLEVALARLCAGSPWVVELDLKPVDLGAESERALYFVAAESLTNVAKYASASSVRISLCPQGTGIELVVADDGAGGADPARGSGLRGLSDRLDTLGGTLIVTSVEGRGTRVTAWIPSSG